MSDPSAIERLKADAARWAYVRDNLVRMHSPKMNGQHSYRFSPLYRYTGQTIEIAIDKAIEDTNRRKKEAQDDR